MSVFKHMLAAIVITSALLGNSLDRPLDFKAAAKYNADRNGVSLLVMQSGKIVFEDYPNNGSPDKPLALASGTKSFSGVMALLAERDGLLKLDEKCANTLTEWKADSQKSKMTIRQLLSLSGGMEGGETGRPPAYADAIQAPMKGNPGKVFSYGPNPYQTFGEIMRRKLEPKKLSPLEYLEKELFQKIGMEVGLWRKGSDGMPHLPSGAFLTAREWVKFGEFVRLGGVAGKESLLPKGAISNLFKPAPANKGYGMTWWLLDGIGAMAAGAGKQRLYILPEEKLVVVRQTTLRMGERAGTSWSDSAFLSALLGKKVDLKNVSLSGN